MKERETVVHGECVTNTQSRCSLLNSRRVNTRWGMWAQDCQVLLFLKRTWKSAFLCVCNTLKNFQNNVEAKQNTCQLVFIHRLPVCTLLDVS